MGKALPGSTKLELNGSAKQTGNSPAKLVATMEKTTYQPITPKYVQISSNVNFITHLIEMRGVVKDELGCRHNNIEIT